MRTRSLSFGTLALLLTACGGGGGGDSGGASTGGSSGGSGGSAPASADVRVTSDPTSAEFFSGSIATYTSTLSNLGPDAASNLTVQAVVGQGQTLSSITCAAVGTTCPGVLGASMTISTLPSGASLTFTVNASTPPNMIGPISHTLHVSATGDPVLSNNVATSTATVRLPTSPQSESFVSLQSDMGDYIGGGGAYLYDLTNALIDVTASGGSLSVNIQGNQDWRANFVLPSSQTQLAPGTYSGLRRYPFHDAAVGGLSWSGEGRGCNQLSGAFTIEAATYVLGSLATLDLRFEQHCEGQGPALRGQIHWNVNDTVGPSGPVNPAPTGLWAPVPGATPTTGNYIYLQSDGGDYIGAGRSYTYTQANSVMTLTANGPRLTVSIGGNESWYADFQGMNVLSNLQPGYYGNLERYPFHNPTAGGLSWGGEGRGCNTSRGWFVVDSITYSGNTLASLDLRFEQHCEGNTPALRGKIHWLAGDPTQPAGPQVPPPSTLWQPGPSATPASGSFVYLESQFGDYIGGGRTYTYTKADALLNISTVGARLDVGINGDDYWTGNFQAMNSLAQLQPGYYSSLQRYPFHNPVTGGLSWYGEGRGCNTLTGWFVIDGIGYSNGSLASIDLRFEQHCEGGGPALRGKIHWTANDATQPPGPQNPPPTSLWSPPSGATPANGNYVYLTSAPGDYIGSGRTYTYTKSDAVLEVTTPMSLGLSVRVEGDQGWSGDFVAMGTLSQLEPGYYAGVQRYPFHNPVRGGMTWSGEGRGCNTLTGWFVIDELTYAGGSVESVRLRFEQHCDGGPALRGAVRWSANDPTLPPGPQQPPPANLWRPAAGTTPTSGNYVHLSSSPGDYIGAGQTYTYVPPNHTVTINQQGRYLYVDVDNGSWGGRFEGMNSINDLQPGYYANLQRYPFHNPARGGLSWDGMGRGCNTLTGWFVVDSITYSAGVLASIDLRFEQVCEGTMPPLRGAIHWIR